MVSTYILRSLIGCGRLLLLLLMLSACAAPVVPVDSGSSTASSSPVAATASPTDTPSPTAEPTVALRYFWPARVPEGLVVQAEQSSADEQRFTLELADPTDAQRTLTLRGGAGLTPPPAAGSTAITVREQPGLAFTTGAGFVIYWQEHSQPYTLAGFFSAIDLADIASSLEPLDLPGWRERLDALAVATPAAAETCASLPGDDSVKRAVALVAPFCVVWRDAYEDEQGFRITLRYLQDPGETFSYEVGPNVEQYSVPQSDQPSTEPPEACARRSSFSISVEALLPDGLTLVGGMAMDSECGQGFAPATPTATATPEPTTAATIDPDLVELRAELEGLIGGWQGTHAVSVTDLGSGQTISVNGDRPQLAACTVKIVIMIAVAQDIQAGLYSEADVTALVQSAMGPSNTWPARELLGRIGEGDIGAGVRRVNAIIAELGATGSILTHPPGYSWEEYGYMSSHGTDENRLTTDDLNLILRKLYRGEVLPESATAYVLHSMTIAPDWMDQPLRAAVGPEARIYHKIGQLYEPENVWNDAAIVEFERDGQRHAYVMSYLGSYGASWQEAYSHETELATIVWRYLGAGT